MTSRGLSCLILADGSFVDANKIIGAGLDGCVIHDSPTSSTVMKIPKFLGTSMTDGSIKPDDDRNMYMNDLSREKDVYRRLQGVPGIANCLDISENGLVLEYYSNGNMEEYLQNNSPSTWTQRIEWILQILDIFIACHDKKVLVFDIALRNLMLDGDWSPKAIDFGNSSLLPLGGGAELVDEDGYTEEIDILHVTNIIYSICRWKKFQVDCAAADEWPAADSLPATADLPLGSIIAESWSHQFKTLNELKLAIASAAPTTVTTIHD
ncbi:unnamed protein product [Aureobasidium uvarum]|uniref:Protein kinase domain-containing protein n=1 Tax=Aureobasidium uvarum TaxID=2773716 RepID=A0A9N8PRL3_9PEZI|nr:unnamed protein product [Aureobasidium uvarum]